MTGLSGLLAGRRFVWGRSVLSLMLREMATSYGRSPGGYLWAVAEPVAALTLLTVVFSFVMRSPPLGNNFALFYATGYLPFMYYSALTSKIGQSIRFSRPLLAYPAVSFFDAILSRFLLNTLTNLVVFVIVMVGIVAFYGLNVSLDLPAILEAFSMAAALAMGVGTLNCYLFSVAPVWERVWAILNRPMFLVSGIFFLMETVPEPFRTLLSYNPLTHVIAKMRQGFFATYDARLVDPLYAYSVSLVCLFFGMLLLNRHHRMLLNEGA
ncbi:ABC transporter permease [Cereibacter johrii]|uniref:Transport permease protein n=1 Tax=Cereibacter johrii TaxID=445629 RepID=A0ABX5J262_9RHOB|nr:ABC transporter permease [Cereibacter johrii]ODM41747.1 sugar ABC transporter permease [Cereibacter johrii]PTM75277.1 capsular polysaccharide transport system permease protein [Cereibacter johrii]